MVETIVLLVFATALVGGIILDLPLLATLVFGLALFLGYGIWRGHKPTELARMASSGLREAGGMIIMFVIIGMLTASWRAAGTIPAITCLSAQIISPVTLVPLTFLLCSAMSFVTGSSFAAAATIGVICATIARAMHCDLALMGGAIMSGAFFGDRCSPLSSSANLVATITHTNVLDNVRRMARFAMVPVAVTLALYVAVGLSSAPSGSLPDFDHLFTHTFNMGWYVLLPVIVVLALSLAHVNVIKTMLASLGVALVLCLTVQHIPAANLPWILVMGYSTHNQAIARMVNGGGVVSMADIAAIVAVASTYSGIFQGTGLLTGLRDHVNKVAANATPFVSVLAFGSAICIIACDQVVAIMLTAQLCKQTERSGSALALDLENSCVVLPALVPWSTSCIGILALLGLPNQSVLFTFLCYLIPLFTLGISVYQHRHPSFASTQGYVLGLDARDAEGVAVRKLAA